MANVKAERKAIPTMSNTKMAELLTLTSMHLWVKNGLGPLSMTNNYMEVQQSLGRRGQQGGKATKVWPK